MANPSSNPYSSAVPAASVQRQLARRDSKASMPNMPAEFREMRREYHSDYDAGGSSRFIRNRKSLYGSADAHYSDPRKFFKAIETARDMYRNDGIIQTLLDRAIANTFRLGFDFEADTGDKDANLYFWQAQQDWEDDPSQCDEAGVLTFKEMQPIAGLAEMLDGDILVHLPPEVPQLQFFEADNLRSPRGTTGKSSMVHGVELGPNRQRLKYWLVNPGLSLSYGRTYAADEVRALPAFNSDSSPRCLQLFDPKRMTQTRGVGALHAVISKAGQYEDIDFTLLVKQQMAASLVWERQQTEAGNNSTPGGYGLAAGRDDQDDRGNRIQYEELAPGTVVDSRFGEKIEMHAPQIPSSETIAHLKMTLQTISCAVGVPLCVLFLDGSETNFSGWRGALDQAKIGWMANQERWERRFHRPVYRRNVTRWVSKGGRAAEFAKALGSAVFRHTWHKPRWPYTNPKQDADAQITQIEGFLNDPYAIAGENGRDADDIIARTIKFNGSAIEAAIQEAERINVKYTKAGVAWRDVLNRSLPKGGQIIDEAEKPNPGPDDEPKPVATLPAKKAG